jgi:hypothetical protein
MNITELTEIIKDCDNRATVDYREDTESYVVKTEYADEVCELLSENYIDIVDVSSHSVSFYL